MAKVDDSEDARFARTASQQAKIDAKAAAKRAKFGGRKKGSVNKKTLEKIAAAEREMAAGVRGTKIAIDHMDEMIDYFRRLVAMHQPWNADGSMREGGNDKLWFRCVEVFQGFLALRAPYQSPRLSAVAIMPQQQHAQRTTVNVTILNERGDKIYSDDERADERGESDTKLIEHEPSMEDDAA